MMKNKVWKFVWALVVIIFFGLIMVYAHRKAQEQISDKVEMCLQECIISDYYQRASSMALSSTYKLRGKVKETSIETSKKRIRYIFKDSVDVEISDRLVNQSILAHINPLIPDSFNTNFKKRLSQFSISGETGIVYRFQNQSCYSDKDSVSVLSAAYKTHYISLDISNTVLVQAWVNWDFVTFIKYMSIFSLPWVGLLLAIVISGLLGFYIWRKKKSEIVDAVPEVMEIMSEARDIVPEVPVTENKSALEENKDLASVAAAQQEENIPDGLYINRLRKLYINKKQVPIKPLTLKVLELLKNNMEKEECVTREYMREILWKNEELEKVNTRIDTHIKEIRKVLQNSGYEVVTVRQTGFCLKASSLS